VYPSLYAYIAESLDGPDHSLVESLIATYRNWHDAYWTLMAEMENATPGEVTDAETQRTERSADENRSATIVDPGITDLAAEEDWGEIERALRPLAPVVLEYVGLDESLCTEFLGYLLGRSHSLAGRRFRECLPAWIEDFATEHRQELRHHISEADYLPIVERAVLRRVMDDTEQADSPDEREWAKWIRHTGRAVTSWRWLRDAQPPESFSREAGFAHFLQDIFDHAEREDRKFKRVFDLN